MLAILLDLALEQRVGVAVPREMDRRWSVLGECEVLLSAAVPHSCGSRAYA